MKILLFEISAMRSCFWTPEQLSEMDNLKVNETFAEKTMKHFEDGNEVNRIKSSFRSMSAAEMRDGFSRCKNAGLTTNQLNVWTRVLNETNCTREGMMGLAHTVHITVT